MRIPHIINENTIKAYKVSKVYLRKEQIKSDDFTWNSNFVKTLRELSLIVIAENFENNPLYSQITIPNDKLQLLELLSTDLPLELTVPIIEEDYYWKRCYYARWPEAPEPNRELRYDKPINTSKTEGIWQKSATVADSSTYRRHSISYQSDKELNMYSYNEDDSYRISEEPSFLRSQLDFSPNDTNKRVINIIINKTWKQSFIQKFVQEEIEKMIPDVFNAEYVKELTDLYGDFILFLHIKQLQSSKRPDNCDHISLYTLLSTLPNIIELRICFNQAHLGDNFTWHSQEISDTDCELLGKGVEKNTSLKVLRVHCSNIDCEKVKLLVRPLCEYCILHTLDLSHCKIGDEGGKAIAGFLMGNKKLEKLILVNNLIGGKYIATALTRGAKSLSSLNIAACGLNVENIHMGLALSMNTSLEKLDISNNDLGEVSADNFLYAMGKNKTLVHMDIRMCGFSPESVQKLQKAVRSNLEKVRQVLKSPPSTTSLL